MIPSVEAFTSVAAAGFALSATPGPSMLYVLSRTVGQSRAAGIASAVGLCLGGVVLAVATALGLAALFNTFEGLVTALRYAGAAYLVWLGIGLIREARARSAETFAAHAVPQRPLGQIVWQGVIVEVLNPKTVLFFALFLPPFIHADMSQGANVDITVQLLLLGILVPLTAVPADVFVAFMGSALTRTLNEKRMARVLLSTVSGLVLIGIAVSLVL